MRKRLTKLLFTFLLAMVLRSPALAQIPAEDLQKIKKALPAQATVKPKQTRKLLIFTRAEGYKHSSIPYAAQALELMGRQTGAFIAVQSEEMAVFAADHLRQFDAVLFVSTSELAFENLGLRQSLMEFVKNGKGVVGIHAATDNFYNWPEAAEMMGGYFEGHPWTAEGTWAVKVVDPSHPLTASFQGKNFQITDEIYRIRPRSLRRNCRVLVALDALDKTNRAAEGVRFGDRDLPISWVQSFGKGRVFYSSFGHNNSIYWNPAILRHYLDGIQFALGDLPVDTTPLPFDVESGFAANEIDVLFEKVATYEYGQSREALMNLTEYFRLAAVSPKLQHQNEQRLLQLLTGKATFAGKQFASEQLSLGGSTASIPTLQKLLQDSTSADLARFALERIPDPQADEALRQALTTTSGKNRIGIMNTIGQRRDGAAVPALSMLVNDADPLTAAAAIGALGKIGGQEAAQVLASAVRKTSGALNGAVADAYLNCADLFLDQENNDKALAIYSELNGSQFSEPVRFAALRGMIQTRQGSTAEFLLSLLTKPDTQPLAVALANEIPSTESVSRIVQVLPSLSQQSQVQLLTSLAERRDAEVRQAAVTATKSPHAEIRIAALQALGKCGDESAVLLLAETAAHQGAEAVMARKSLHQLGGAAVDERVVQEISAAQKQDVKIELILAANQRGIQSAAPILLQTAKAPEAAIRLASIEGLANVASEEHLPALLELLIYAPGAPERQALEKTIIAVAMKAPPEKRVGGIVRTRLTALPAGTNSETRESLLKILGSIGDEESLPVLVAALGDTATQVQTAAIVALSDWPNSTPKNKLLAVAESSRHPSQQILALRGFVHLLRFESAFPTASTVNEFQRALKLAPNPNEQKMILGWLAEVRALGALETAAIYMQDEKLRSESEIAAVKIAGAVSGSHPAETKTLLQKILQNATSDTLPHVQQAHALIRQIERFEDYLTAWAAAGPYFNPQANIFDYSFPPEQPGQTDIAWQVMPASINPEQPWLLQLDRIFKGENCAAYLHNQIWSDKEQRVRMEVGSDDGVKVWLNGEMVHANNVSRGTEPGDDVFEVSLHKGWNPLLLKITQGGGGWGACARLRNLQGGKLAGVRAALQVE